MPAKPQVEEIDEAVEPTDDDLVFAAVAIESERRKWLRALMPILSNRSRESDPSDRVQLALDLLVIEASERARRILRSDLSGEHDGTAH